MNTSNNNLKDFLADKFHEIRDFVKNHLKIVIPVLVAIVAVIVLVIALSAHSRKVKLEAEQAAAQAEQESQISADDATITIPEVALEEEAHPDVTEFINKYYAAMADGDIDAVKSMNNYIDDTETIRIEETAQYIDSYPTITVYTKNGPSDGTYIAYVYSELKFTDYDTVVPGMMAYYVCTDDSGNLYINDGEESDTVINYIREVSLQDDVVDLNNEVAVKYNDMLAADENLSVFLVDLTNTIDTSVGEKLAEAEGTSDTDTETAETDEESDEETTVISSDTVTTVKATTAVNVRSSDSETADKVGKAAEGEEFTLIEERGNGWSEIDYNGTNAFIKSEFLEKSTETKITVDNSDSDDSDTKTAEKTDTSSATVSGTVTVKESVRIRSSASETADKLGTAYAGQKLDLIMKQSDGWTKIKYNGQTAYVKSDYVE